jgi:hypothetical protein
VNGRRKVLYSAPNLYLPASSIIKTYRAIIKTYRAHQQAPTRKRQLVCELVVISSNIYHIHHDIQISVQRELLSCSLAGLQDCYVRLRVWTSRTCLISRLLLSSYVLFEKLSSSWLSCTRFYLKQPQAATQAAARSTVVDWPRPWSGGPQRMSACVGGTS